MYHYEIDPKLKKEMRKKFGGIVNELKTSINNEKKIKVKTFLVGSGAKHLETQNEKRPIDLDYNIQILQCSPDMTDEKDLKEYIRKKFNDVLKRKGMKDCNDSTSVLSTKKETLLPDCLTKVSMDLGIARVNKNGKWERLIHKKTGDTKEDQYYWNEAQDSKDLEKKAEQIKKKGKWEKVRESYLNKKNFYLKRKEESAHPSFNVYIETINEVYAALPKEKPALAQHKKTALQPKKAASTQSKKSFAGSAARRSVCCAPKKKENGSISR